MSISCRMFCFWTEHLLAKNLRSLYYAMIQSLFRALGTSACHKSWPHVLEPSRTAIGGIACTPTYPTLAIEKQPRPWHDSNLGVQRDLNLWFMKHSWNDAIPPVRGQSPWPPPPAQCRWGSTSTADQQSQCWQSLSRWGWQEHYWLRDSRPWTAGAASLETDTVNDCQLAEVKSEWHSSGTPLILLEFSSHFFP